MRKNPNLIQYIYIYMKGPKQKGDFSLENLVYCDEYPSTRGTVRAATRNAFMRLRTVLIWVEYII